MNHNYIVYSADGQVINKIHSSEQFIAQYCEVYGYTYEQEADILPPEAIEPIPAKKREEAYNTERIIVWGEEMLTITRAATLWQYYAAEGSDKAQALTALIVEAKEAIRAKYPDAESEA